MLCLAVRVPCSSMSQLLNCVTETERFYGKDAPCPREWYEWLTSSGVIPPSLLPDSADNLLLNTPQSVRP